MTLYNVHIFREMRLFYPGIDASSHEEAASIAADKLTEEAEYTEDCDGQNLAALVDLAGDAEFEQSRIIDFDREPSKSRRLTTFVQALQQISAYPASANSDRDVMAAALNAIAGIAERALAEFDSLAAALPPEPIIIEVRGGVVQDVSNVPPGFNYEIRDHDNMDAAFDSCPEKVLSSAEKGNP
jgi:hypothetical protein